MGLSAVVHGIITSYAGAIMVASTPGQGTTFAIYLRLPGINEATDRTEEILPRVESGHISALPSTMKAAAGQPWHQAAADAPSAMTTECFVPVVVLPAGCLSSRTSGVSDPRRHGYRYLTMPHKRSVQRGPHPC